MNPHIPGAGAPMPITVPLPHQSRRHQEYHQYQQYGPPRSPGPHNPYAGYHYPPFYSHPSPMQYPMQRWPSHSPYPPYAMHPQAQYPPRSPLVVSSQPQVAGTPATRPPPFSHVPFAPQSPHPPAPQSSNGLPTSVESPKESLSKPSTPQPVSRRSSTVATPQLPTRRMPFYPELPWYSTPEARESFPPKAARRRARKQDLHLANDALTLPGRESWNEEEEPAAIGDAEMEHSDASTIAVQSQRDTPATSLAPSEQDTQDVPVPSMQEVISAPSTTAPQHVRKDTRTAIPILPVIPQIPLGRHKQTGPTTEPSPQNPTAEDGLLLPNAREPSEAQSVVPEHPVLNSPPTKPAVPKSWADLVRTKNAKALATESIGALGLSNGAVNSRGGSLTEALTQFRVGSGEKIVFLEPRGLVNTGNMCYMNSILQILVFCTPFYNLLDQVGRRAAHSFKSDTPLIDAMIMFMREFKVIDSADSVDKLRLRLKDGELEEYGEPFIPEYVYDVIKRVPRFASMRRGHQQDAEEFLGFLLAGLHDECLTVTRSHQAANSDTAKSQQDGLTSPTSTSSQPADSGWLEVGPRQKAAVTRQAGDSTSSSPVTSIFGGALRSELRVPGLKNSVTLEPYQPLQLDIGASNISNIADALRGLTKPETLTGDFHSPRGPGINATKQVFIESLPPVLILHLKRFQYDSSGGTQKIWKKIGYPLELEIPKEVYPPSKRGGLAVKGGLPKYRLTAVVYHHGKSAAGGHYTVDICRQDSREWVRVDDTLIRRIRPEDVAEGGAEEDPKILAKALEQHKADQDLAKRNLFEGLDGEEEHAEESKAWNEVNSGDIKRKWAGVAASAGTATPSTAGKATPRREHVKDNKVAYILLYERISE